MKTLDEVIKANECCDHGEIDSRCEDCPYNGIGACCAEREFDALHYLKEYKEKQNTRIYIPDGYTHPKIGDKNFSCPECHAEFIILPEENPVLDWETLKTMEGKPVWVENVFGLAEWELVANVKEDNVYTIGADEVGADIPKEDYPHRWQAYRKERS